MEAGRSAVESFCRMEYPRLVAAMTLYTGDPDLAAELAQEALARAHRDWARVSELPAPGAWTHRVVVNLANSAWRRRRYEHLARSRAAARLRTSTAEFGVDGGAIEIRRALTGLPARQREAVVLRYLLDLSVEQTAERMHCAAGTVRALTSQGIARLRLSEDIALLEENTHD